jgi:mono/diheme cytochrome c family protein
MASARKKKVMTMKKISMNLLCGAALASASLLSGCALEVENTKAAEELARLAQPPGSVYTGWRVFQDRCTGCHGAPATGTVAAPDLLPIVRNMGPRRFVGLVLMRYDWSLPAGQAGGDSAEREALIEGVMQRKQGALTMPEWQGEPRVNAHIMDLYAYLSARADGSQGAGRPAP